MLYIIVIYWYYYILFDFCPYIIGYLHYKQLEFLQSIMSFSLENFITTNKNTFLFMEFWHWCLTFFFCELANIASCSFVHKEFMNYKTSWVSVMRAIGLNFMMVLFLVLVLVLVGSCYAPALM